MTEAQNKTTKHKSNFKRWEYWAGIAGILVTLLLAALVVINRDIVQELAGYGYLGLFFVSALGGATVLVPVPMLAVQFAMGGILEPWFGPLVLGPLFVGIVSGFSETLGAMTIYLTGYGGGTPLKERNDEDKPKGRLTRAYIKIMKMMEKRGSLTIFLVSAVINPFFYPVSLAAGAVRFGLARYFFIALSGKIIKCSMIAYAGYFGLRGIFEAVGISL